VTLLRMVLTRSILLWRPCRALCWHERPARPPVTTRSSRSGTAPSDGAVQAPDILYSCGDGWCSTHSRRDRQVSMSPAGWEHPASKWQMSVAAHRVGELYRCSMLVIFVAALPNVRAWPAGDSEGDCHTVGAGRIEG